ncbi:hypothetical protein AVEN_213289-1 [Araneus ventricosus]|uniref:Uncharacterized protein n=1 Tax=Araneus ventricosus TaxID=182803 RepID=A0A4Y2INN0_ARAVE|nr:hypothetical protein AVEN_213289-1 [Araneus ventricosus]
MEQIIKLKFLYKLGKSESERHAILKQVYADDTVTLKTVFSCDPVNETQYEPKTKRQISYRIHLQWIPSHVNIQGNEIADGLAKAGTDDASVPSASLTYLELFSRAKSRNKTILLIPPVHHWYHCSQPVGCL